jgi:hypothetical protein
MVKIYKGFEGRESALLATYTDPIRPTREMSWPLAEDDYYVVVFWNNSKDSYHHCHIAVLEDKSYLADVSSYHSWGDGDLTFKQQ